MDFWGEEWEAREAQYAGKVALDAAWDPAHLESWDEAGPELVNRARAEHERHLPSIRKLFMGGVDIGTDGTNPELRAELSDIDAELEYLAARYEAEVNAAVALALSRTPERYPLVDLRPAEKAKGDFYRMSVESGGWYVTFHCNYADSPEVARLEKEKAPLIFERFRRLKAFQERQAGR